MSKSARRSKPGTVASLRDNNRAECLGDILFTARRISGKTGQEIAARAGISQSAVSKIEAGKLVPSIALIRRYVTALSLSDNERRNVLTWAEAVVSYDQLVPFNAKEDIEKSQRLIRSLEVASTRIRSYQHSIIPGLLQAPDYVKGVFASARLSRLPPSLKDIENAISERQKRQRIISESVHQVEIVIHESALYSLVVPRQTMLLQLSHLLSLNLGENVSVGILAFDTEWEGGAPLTGFDILNDRLVILEAQCHVIYVWARYAVSEYVATFQTIYRKAQFGDLAREKILRAIDHFKGHGSVPAVR